MRYLVECGYGVWYLAKFWILCKMTRGRLYFGKALHKIYKWITIYLMVARRIKFRSEQQRKLQI